MYSLIIIIYLEFLVSESFGLNTNIRVRAERQAIVFLLVGQGQFLTVLLVVGKSRPVTFLIIFHPDWT